MAIGDRLKELRLRKGDSLQQVADAIGASKAHIWELEMNRSKNPSLDLLQRLAAHFKTTVAYLIDETAGDQTAAQQFFRKNNHKLSALDESQFSAIESLLDVISAAKKE